MKLTAKMFLYGVSLALFGTAGNVWAEYSRQATFVGTSGSVVKNGVWSDVSGANVSVTITDGPNGPSVSGSASFTINGVHETHSFDLDRFYGKSRRTDGVLYSISANNKRLSPEPHGEIGQRATGYLTVGLDANSGSATDAVFRSVNGLVSIDLSFESGSFDYSGIRGDADNDGMVGFSDFVILSQTYGQTGSNLAADFNNDGKVSVADFVILSGNYGFEF